MWITSYTLLAPAHFVYWMVHKYRKITNQIGLFVLPNNPCMHSNKKSNLSELIWGSRAVHPLHPQNKPLYDQIVLYFEDNLVLPVWLIKMYMNDMNDDIASK